MPDIPTRPARKFLPEELNIDNWEDIKPYFDELESRDLNSFEALEKWLHDLSETEAVLEEDAAWRYIKMTINTKDEEALERYSNFVKDIQPKIAPYSDKYNRKLIDCPYTSKLTGKAYEIYLRKIASDIELFREENIPLQSEIQQLSQQFGQITGGLSVEINGEKFTLQKAAAELQSTDRNYREQVYRALSEVRASVIDELDELFDKLVAKRHQLAVNAGFENYRDYKFKAMGRFDYSKEDCFDFHESVAKAMCPIAKDIALDRKNRLGYEVLRPWDMSVDPDGKEALKPFKTAKELVQNSIRIFEKVDPYFGDCLEVMDEMGYLDLESKEGKAPGGYNYPLYEIGVPFIFMNAVGTPRDLVTMMHEGGHAVHSFLTRDLELTSFKSCPSEVAELASMSMELLTLEYWSEFYTNDDSFKRAKKEHLEDILSMLPWIAMIDKFQHRLYENPGHSKEERKKMWQDINDELGLHVVDWSGFEDAKDYSWQKQLHLFEVPFYYIEYGMAQLGALAVWKNYKEDPKKAISDFTEALKLGYTRSIGEIYETAGIKFDFSEANMNALAAFVKEELAAL